MPEELLDPRGLDIEVSFGGRAIGSARDLELLKGLEHFPDGLYEAVLDSATAGHQAPRLDSATIVVDLNEERVLVISVDEETGAPMGTAYWHRNERWSWNTTSHLTTARHPGQGEAVWRLQTGCRLDGNAVELPVAVTELACTGATPCDDRLLPPIVDDLPEALVLTFSVMPLPPGNYTCPGNPPALVDVSLPTPIGDRAILDGHYWPARRIK